jgi:6-pyruvoyl-tetrahydropterin synthase
LEVGVDITASASAQFNAGHLIKELLACTRQHGHFYDVEATVSGELDPVKGWPRGTEHLPTDLWEIVKELEGRQLNDMMPGVTTTPVGIAAYFMERLAINYPRLTSVEVRCSDHTAGRVSRTPR